MLHGVSYKSPLHQMTQTTGTCLWNDSAAEAELAYAIEHGAVGATCNPVIAVEVVKKELAYWTGRIKTLAAEHSTATEGELAWRVIEEMSASRAAMLRPVFDAQRGRNGRLSIQTDPRLFRNGPGILEQAIHFDALAPNMIVKIPATFAGIWAIEEATSRGISINATVSFSVPQAIAVAEAVERGLRRHEAAGGDTSRSSPVCSLMIGRLDDWVKVVVERDDIALDPAAANWAGLAVFKRAYGIFGERGYRTRLLAAAFRHRLHWTELVGGDVVLTMPYAWQVRFNASWIEPVERIGIAVASDIVDDLLRRIPDFARAYEPDGLTIDEFDSFGPTVRTLRTFISGYHDLQAAVRDIVLPDPDVRSD